ncbi:MAG: hypothetical protein HXY34_10245 [Candidatus Thorarchaeota archaeon]|nr:hypothetical protein [Candidatus Thorarchaeota archaeon]
MSEPKQYFRGEDLGKAVEWLKKHMQSADVIAEIEGTLVDTGAQVSCSGLVIQAEDGFGKPESLVIRLDKKPRWTSEQMISIGKPNAGKGIDVAAKELFMVVKARGQHEERRRSSTRDRRYDDRDYRDSRDRRYR